MTNPFQPLYGEVGNKDLTNADQILKKNLRAQEELKTPTVPTAPVSYRESPPTLIPTPQQQIDHLKQQLQPPQPAQKFSGLGELASFVNNKKMLILLVVVILLLLAVAIIVQRQQKQQQALVLMKKRLRRMMK